MPERLCRHEPCGCAPPAGDAYCSPRCAELDVDALATECGCGHPDCHPHHAEPIELHVGDPAPSEVEEEPR